MVRWVVNRDSGALEFRARERWSKVHNPSCDGELLPDGRCRQYHFLRLPLLSAQAPAR